MSGIIEPGPSAQRTPTYFMQDGTYQERVFREIEERDPSIEHLGNWHTHHVNMLHHLSNGDIQTYRRTVEHQKHNTNFFYALLVTERKKSKTSLQRYTFKNYVLQRGDPAIYEIPANALTLTDSPLSWPIPIRARSESPAKSLHIKTRPSGGETEEFRANLVHDHEVVSQFYPKVKTFKSEELGIFWRGPVSLIDGSEPEGVILQDESGKTPVFTITLRKTPEILSRSIKALAKEVFPSCRAALIATERMCNAELYEKHSKNKERQTMDVLTLYVGQGALVGIRIGNEGIIVDAHLPENAHVTPEEIQQSLSLYFRNVTVRGLILSGFDADHAHAGGVEWILSQFTPDWIMYPKYFKDTDNAHEVFRSIVTHEKRRALSSRPLTRHSIRLDKLDSREIAAFGRDFSIEVFSPRAV